MSAIMVITDIHPIHLITMKRCKKRRQCRKKRDRESTKTETKNIAICISCTKWKKIVDGIIHIIHYQHYVNRSGKRKAEWEDSESQPTTRNEGLFKGKIGWRNKTRKEGCKQDNKWANYVNEVDKGVYVLEAAKRLDPS